MTSQPWTLHEGDCLAWLKTLGPGSVDAVVTDPPYGKAFSIGGETRTSAERRATRLKGDDSQEVGQIALDWAAEHGLPTVAFANPMKPWAGQWRQHLVWDKGPVSGTLGDWQKTWKPSWELIQVARNGTIFGQRESSVLTFRRGFVSTRSIHPTQKPVPLMRYLLRKLFPPGALIVDPFAGSGSTGVAALLEGMRFAGCEIDPKYAALSRRNLREAAVTLFPAEVAG
jgi:DNA modification methylase